MMHELALDASEQGFLWPLAEGELEVIGRAWQTAGVSVRKLKKIIEATLEARETTAVKH